MGKSWPNLVIVEKNLSRGGVRLTRMGDVRICWPALSFRERRHELRTKTLGVVALEHFCYMSTQEFIKNLECKTRPLVATPIHQWIQKIPQAGLRLLLLLKLELNLLFHRCQSSCRCSCSCLHRCSCRNCLPLLILLLLLSQLIHL